MKYFSNGKAVSLLVTMVIILSSISFVNAQETTFRNQSWRYGINAAYQVNAPGLGWQTLHGTDGNFHSPLNSIDYVDGTGGGIYTGIFGEYLSTSWWGLQFRISYDVRDALVIDDTRKPIPSFDTKMSYITFEPLFRVDQHLIPNLNIYAGPYLAANVGSSFIYNSDYLKTDKENTPVTEPSADVKDVNKITYGLQAGIAYDIKIGQINEHTSMLLSPFFDASWMINQKKTINEPDQNSISDVWSTVSYRFGLRLSMDYMKEVVPVVPEAEKPVTIILPVEGTIITKNVKGYFPIHPYVFFEKGSNEIPLRYASLSRADAINFNESDLVNFTKGDLTTKETNVDQLMTSYYNVMNIYGDRMRKNPSEKLTLTGSDPLDRDAELYANKVKSYLVTNFDIDPNRITIKVAPPQKPSGTYYTDPAFSGQIDDENRRVVFSFNNPDMLKPLAYTIRDESSIDNDIIFTIGKDVQFNSWDVIITGEDRTLYFGPFGYSSERINPTDLMRFLESGKYNAKITILEKSGKTTEENIGFKLYKSRELKNASRYLMIFEYNKSDAVLAYETKIRKEITPGIVEGNRVVVHGHTDNIGNEAGNQQLSQDRANQAKGIIDDELTLEGKKVDVRAIATGQTKNPYTFANRFPEGRMYNRNVFVEIVE